MYLQTKVTISYPFGFTLKPIESELKEYQFLITDYLFLSPEKDLPIQNFSSNYEIFGAENFLS